jgi:hypothetical protein
MVSQGPYSSLPLAELDVEVRMKEIEWVPATEETGSMCHLMDTHQTSKERTQMANTCEKALAQEGTIIGCKDIGE